MTEASAGLAFASSFFHGSHTELGQLLDNHMIKVLSYILYQTHIEASELQHNSKMYHLKSIGKRQLTGIEMAESMTEMFRSKPLSEWKNHANGMDVPKYELTFSAFVLTILEQIGANNSLFSWAATKLTEAINMSKADRQFLFRVFQVKMKYEMKEWNRKNKNLMKLPDFYNAATVLLRSFAAFPFQESFDLNPKIIKLFNFVIYVLNVRDGKVSNKNIWDKIKKLFYKKMHDTIKDAKVSHYSLDYYLQDFNENLDRFSTFPLIEPFNGKDVCLGGYPTNTTMELFPGMVECQSNHGTKHSVWHAQSARALIDMFKFVDEFIGKRKNLLMEDDVFDNIASDAVEQIEKSKAQIEDLSE